IARCQNDVGIYLNKAAETQIYNNIIQGSLGIDVRFPSSSAVIINNILDGRIKERDGGLIISDNNLITGDCPWSLSLFQNCQMNNWYRNPIAGDFRITRKNLPSGIDVNNLKNDFCGNPRDPNLSIIGPLQLVGNQANCLP
ncbi:MAG: hypothetical protein GY777_09295, partial [Candidatus Brocadiaceae bacterium]|nr:hypothetical protein [Candidatus Brocadiaceae bacterium]